MPRLLLRSSLVAICTIAVIPAAEAGAAAALGSPAQKVTSIGHTTVTVSAPAAHATSYRLFVSVRRSDVYVDNLARARHTSATRSSTITMSTLPYTTKTLWYRVGAYSGSKHRYSATIGSFALRPSAPTALKYNSSTSLTWTGASATGYQVEQRHTGSATKRYTLRSITPQFTPYGLAKGQSYSFRVRSLNGGTASAWTASVRGTVGTSEQTVKVLSYNILEGRFAGQKAGGNTIATWAARRDKVAGLITEAAPDVVMIQEGASYVGSPQGKNGTRQVDDLNRLLTSYSLAHTEKSPKEPGFVRRGVYVLYRTAAFTPVGQGGVVTPVADNYAAYQLLRSRTTGARLLAVSPHLPKTAGKAGDQMRQKATTNLVKLAEAKAGGAPIVYAGDFNSNTAPTHAFDGSGLAMRALRHADAIDAAQATKNASYNSANQYLRTPPKQGDSIDHIYAPPGVAVQSFAVLLHLSKGKFVGTIPSDHNPIAARLSIRYLP